MIKRFFTTNPTSWTFTLLRLALGIVFFPHGAQLMLGWFGGNGFTGSMGFFTRMLRIPALFAFLAIFTQFFGALALITGLLTRLAAAGQAATMSVAILMVHLQNGFFMNWYGTQKGEGFEFHILAITIAIALVIGGAGKLSADEAIASRLK